MTTTKSLRRTMMSLEVPFSVFALGLVLHLHVELVEQCLVLVGQVVVKIVPIR